MAEYPHSAGHYGVDTSIAAAEVVNKALPLLQGQVHAVVAQAGIHGATCDEIASMLGWERVKVRPRASELRRQRRISDSGQRRPSDSGIASIVWVVAELMTREARYG
jgi:hypothetical protein